MDPSGKMNQCLKDTSSRNTRFGGRKGQQKGNAVTGNAGKPVQIGQSGNLYYLRMVEMDTTSLTDFGL
jgi:hypothetical protein